MRSSLSILLLVICVFSCKELSQETTSPVTEEKTHPLSPQENIAAFYRIGNWDTVTELRFTFNVSRSETGYSRSYVWNTSTDDVIFMNENDTIEYNRKAPLDSLAIYADKRFVNDSFWLLSPYKLVWDEGTTISDVSKVTAPISRDTLNKLTIVYGSEGGYTPGDAYDFYFTDAYEIREWVYRKENSGTASVLTTWDKHETYGDLRFNTLHQDSLKSFKLYFTDISVK